MILAMILAATFVELHGPSGQLLEVNPAEVSSLRTPLELGSRHWATGTKCVCVMTNGKFIALAEDCATAVEKLGQK